MKKVIGIDPGLAETGIGVIQFLENRITSFSYGSIKTNISELLPERLNQIFNDLDKVMRSEKPDLLVLEDIFFMKKYPKSGITLGKVSGVILLSSCRLNVPVIEIPVREAKQILTGNGNASKEQLETVVRNLLNQKTSIRPFHASDALALAIIGMRRFKICTSSI
jgi:crossover junction endodeoxyribonuclease RuvC